jgi:hypothetical protein
MDRLDSVFLIGNVVVRKLPYLGNGSRDSRVPGSKLGTSS